MANRTTRKLAGPPWAWLAMALLAAGCGSGEEPPAAVTVEPASAEEVIEPPPEPEPLPVGLEPVVEPWMGDLDGMVERRMVRVLLVHSPVLYFVDQGRELGLTYEAIKAFEKHLNESLARRVVKVHVIPLPVARDELIPRLLAGQGDIAAALLTVTPERRQQVDFSQPFARDIDEVVVTGPGTAPLASLEELAGMTLHVRASSSYKEHLDVLNARLLSQGRAPVEVVPADETLEDGDLLEMVDAGLIPGTVADSFLADLWKQVFPKLVVHREVPLTSGNEIAWAFRKGSPKLAAAVNAFAKGYRQGTLRGNILIHKYLKTTKWVTNVYSKEEMARFRSMVGLFKKYADQYDFDWLLMAAQGYQESALDQSKVSPVGAIGVMQVMPSTARSKAVNIPDIRKLERNIHAGIKYDRWLAKNFYDDPAIDPGNQALLALASYNAGPGRIARLRKEAAARGLDPNRWFDNVELIAAKRIGRETVQYVGNIYKYYVAYQLAIQGDKRVRERLEEAFPPGNGTRRPQKE